MFRTVYCSVLHAPTGTIHVLVHDTNNSACIGIGGRDDARRGVLNWGGLGELLGAAHWGTPCAEGWPTRTDGQLRDRAWFGGPTTVHRYDGTRCIGRISVLSSNPYKGLLLRLSGILVFHGLPLLKV